MECAAGSGPARNGWFRWEAGTQRVFVSWARIWILFGAFHLYAAAGNAADFVHGLWLWKSQAVLEAPHSANALLKFCESESINEVYVSVAANPPTMAVSNEQQIAHLIALLHRSSIRVEALLSSVDADQPGQPRHKLIGRVQGILRFRFLPDLASTYRAVRVLAGPAGMTVNVDIPVKYLKEEIDERRMLLSAMPRLPLMLYE
jgi:hypothetical protein